jgi:hypothetical protein
LVVAKMVGKKSTPVRFELTLPREMPKLTFSCIAGHRVNHSAKVPCCVAKFRIIRHMKDFLHWQP